MKTSRKIVVTALCIATACGSLQIASAATDGPDGGFIGPAVVKALGSLKLTEAQKDQIAGVISRQRDANREALNGVVEARKQLFALVHADTPDEQAIRLASRIVASREEELAVRRAKTVHELKQVLTDGQRATLKDLRATAEERFESRRGRIPAMVDAWVDTRLGD